MESCPLLLFYATDHRYRIVRLPVILDKTTNLYSIDFSLLIKELEITTTLSELKDGLLESLVSDLTTWDALVRTISGLVLNYPNIAERFLIPEGSSKEHHTAVKKINILFVHTSQLRSNEFYYNLLTNSDGLRRVSTDINSKTRWEADKFLPAPIITVSEEALMTLYSETTALEFQLDRISWKKDRRKRLDLYRLNIDHRIKFLDSSIWHRYVNEKDYLERNITNKQNFDQKIKETLLDICDYWKMGLYRTNSGLATLEFQSRMFLQSWLFPVGKRDHQDAVTPFKFHSEGEARANSAKLLEFLKCEGEGKLKLYDLEWHLLMVDDQAAKPVSSIDEKSCKITKANLIRYWIQGNRPAGFDDDLNTREGLRLANIVEQTGKNGQDKGIIKQGIQSLR